MPKIKKKSPGVITFKTPSNLPRGVSKEETSLYNVIQLEFPNKKIQRSNRQILGGRELDIYIPENKLAIEFDGLYFHSTAKKDDSFYHLWKTIECEKRGIRLIHVLSDEWELKRPLVLDVIYKALGKYTLIEGKDCLIEELSPLEESLFLKNNHLNGYNKESVLCIGLSYNNSTIMSLSFLKKDKIWIINRITSGRGYLVNNGLNIILNYFIQKYFIKEEESLYISIDRRFESSYDIPDTFLEVEPSNPKVTFTKDFQHRFTKDNFKKFDESTLLKGGWQKVYDCGRRRFKLNN